MDVAASLENETVIFDERRAYEEQEPDLFLVDLTLSYKVEF